MARAMKDSGVEWIGEIPEGWEISRNKNCFSCGKEIVGHTSVDTQLLSLTTKGVKKKSETDVAGKVPESYDTYQVVETNDLIMCLFDLDCSAVFSGLSPYNGMVSPAYKILKCNSSILPEYAQFWFSFIFDGRKFKSYAKNLRYTLNYDEFAVLPILLPDVAEQKKIVDFLIRECARIDAVIEQTRASIEEYKKLKQSVITEAVTKGIRPGRKMKDSGIEWVKKLPEDWAVIPSKYLFRNSDMRRLDNDEQMTASQQYGIITQAQYMELTGAKVVFANKGLEDWKHVEPYDFIISLRSFQGGLEMSETTGCITWHYIVLKPCKPIYSYYFKWLFKSELYIKALQRTCNFIRDGQDLRYSNFVQVPLFEPSLEEQKEIADYLNEKCAEIDTLISKKEGLVAELESYKKSLIFEYVTGKKEVPHQQETLSINFINMRALLMCRIIELMKPKGRIHLLKALYAIDCLSGLNNQTQYVRYTHGPYDTRIEEYETAMAKHGWAFSNRGAAVEYRRGKNFAEYRGLYQRCFHDLDPLVRKICSFLKPMKTSQAERVATLLAVWNDFLLDGATPTDKEIVQEVRSHWTPNKAHSEEATWFDTLRKIKENNLVPRGMGLHTTPKGKG